LNSYGKNEEKCGKAWKTKSEKYEEYNWKADDSLNLSER